MTELSNPARKTALQKLKLLLSEEAILQSLGLFRERSLPIAFPATPGEMGGSQGSQSPSTSNNISNLREGPETAHPESPVICQEALEHFLTVYNGGQRLGSPVGSSIIQVTAQQHTWIKLYFRISHRFCSCEYLSPCPTHHRTHKPLGTLPHTQELFSSLSCLASSICKTSLEPALESGSVLPDCTWP